MMNWPDDYIGKVICGDSEVVMRDIPVNGAHLVVTDPPYGTDFDYYSKGRGGKLAPQQDYGEQNWNKVKPSDSAILELLKVSCHQVIFGGIFFTEVLPPSTSWIVWDKDNTGNWGDCELAWTSHKSSIRKFKHRWNGMLQENMANKDVRVHPTQKPIALMRWIIEKYSEEGDIILDPFAGSGTTLVAAKELNRRFIGIEIDPKYCEIARERLKQEELFAI